MARRPAPTVTTTRATGHRVRRVVTTRAGGSSAPPYDTFNLGAGVGDDPSAVRANRARLTRRLGVTSGDVVWMHQVHGDHVAVVDARPAALVPDTDALVTTRAGVVLAVLAADCVPVLLADPQAGVVAAVHAGRRGASAGVALRALEVMVRLGADPARTDALLGPAVCGRCYEVPEPMQADVESHLPGSRCHTRDGAPGLDLRAGLAAQLSTAGVATVARDRRCTVEDPEMFSHRRDGVTGRQVGLIWIDG